LTSLELAVTAFDIPKAAASTPIFINSLEYFLAVCAKLKVVISENTMKRLFFK
jgi:hypothetical protein